MSKNKYLNKKINRNDNDILSESDNIVSLAKRDELAETYFKNAINEKNAKIKQTLLEKAYNLNNTKFKIVKEYLEILNKNLENTKGERYKNVNKVFNFLNFKYSKNDLISFFNDLSSYKVDDSSVDKLINEKKNEFDDYFNLLNQPINTNYNENLYYKFSVLEFEYNYLTISENLLKSLYKNKEKMLIYKSNIFINLFKEKINKYDIDEILFYLNSYFTYSECNTIKKMMDNDEFNFSIIEFKKKIEQAKNETLNYINIKKRKNFNDITPEINNNDELIFNDLNGYLVKISDYQNFTYDGILKKFNTLKKIPLDYIKYSKIKENNYFNPFLDFLKNLLKEIIGSKTIKSYLEFYLTKILLFNEEDCKKYINILYLNFEEIWGKIKFLPIISDIFSALTDKLTLNIYMPCTPFSESNALLREEYRKFINCAIFVIIFLHELLGHFFKIYLMFFITDNDGKKYSFNSKDNLGKNTEGRNNLEEKLFGKKINLINLEEALYILNIYNYNYNYDNFRSKFQNIKKVSNEIIEINYNDLPSNLISLLNQLNIECNELNEAKKETKNFLTFKSCINNIGSFLTFNHYGFDTIP